MEQALASMSIVTCDWILIQLDNAVSAKGCIPLQGIKKFAGEAYYVVGHLIRPILLSPITNKYIVSGQMVKIIWLGRKLSLSKVEGFFSEFVTDVTSV